MRRTDLIAHYIDRFGFPRRIAAEIVDELRVVCEQELYRIGTFTIPRIAKVAGANTGSFCRDRNGYTRLAKKHHPDKNSGDKASEWIFKENQSAYESLLDVKAAPPGGRREPPPSRSDRAERDGPEHGHVPKRHTRPVSVAGLIPLSGGPCGGPSGPYTARTHSCGRWHWPVGWNGCPIWSEGSSGVG